MQMVSNFMHANRSNTSNGEKVNCDETGAESNDIHIYLSRIGETLENESLFQQARGVSARALNNVATAVQTPTRSWRACSASAADTSTRTTGAGWGSVQTSTAIQPFSAYER